jgi:sucrose-phosphate synthase
MTKKKGLYIQLYSIHGLIRSENVEYGRDADTGGQIKYVLELGKALSEDPRIEKVELITRQVKDKNVSADYSKPEEKINDKFSIIRIRAGGGKYIRKELLWNHLEEFIDKCIKHIKSGGRLPDVIHGHYADAGYVCSELTKFFGIPFVQTGHSLGRAKLRRLLGEGLEMEDVEKRYKINHRIDIEETVIYYADMIVTSTSQEIKEQYGEYKNSSTSKFRVIPPGVDIEKFYPYNEERQIDQEAKETITSISEKLHRFFMDIDKPIILTLCRPDKRKNISGLITAYGEDKELRGKANLAIFAGIRKDIQTMPDNEREVLTEILLLMDKYNLYGKMAIPKKHDTLHEVPELYRIAAETGGIFVNAALTEPFGLTLIESAASGVPIVATDDGGPRDIIANCKNGILVDVSDYKNISKALNKILDDKKLWKEFSENGMKNVKKYYTWKAHKDKYINELEKIFSKETEKPNNFGHVGRKLLDMKKLIVTDIDHTLLGDDSSLAEFNKIVNKVSSEIGFAVATGRTVESAFKVLEEHNVMHPIVIISSVGSEIYYNYKGELIYSKGWKAHINHQWNKEKIIDLLKGFDFLQLQEEDGQREFKISYYTFDDSDNLEKIKDILIKNKIKANIIFSHGQFLDILPFRASKGKAIRYLSYRWNIPYENILVAGDSGNDEEMLKGELLGVVVGNYSHELDYLRESKRVYFSNQNYAGGIIDGINYYKFLTDGKGNLSE